MAESQDKKTEAPVATKAAPPVVAPAVTAASEVPAPPVPAPAPAPQVKPDVAAETPPVAAAPAAAVKVAGPKVDAPKVSKPAEKAMVEKPAVAKPLVEKTGAAKPVASKALPSKPSVPTPKAKISAPPAPAKAAIAAVVPAKPRKVPAPVKPTPVEGAVPRPAAKAASAAVSNGAIGASAPLAAHTRTPFNVPRTASFKDLTMNMTTNFSGFQDAITEAQAKAKAAFEKSTSVLGEVGEFTKGNVEALMESGKIFAEGVQDLGSTFAAESRTAFETATSDLKELAAAKSPTDFLKIQSDMVRKSFDSAVAYGSKNSEAMLKLVSDSFAPISGRVSLAVEKARQTASL